MLEDYGAFIKLVEKEYVEDTLNGILHFSSLKSFAELEEKYTGGIADRNEGTLNITLPMSKAFVRVKNSNEIIPLGDIKGKLKYALTESQKTSIGICCFMYLPLSKFTCKENGEVLEASFNNKLREQILKFLSETEDEKGKSCEIMMVDSTELIELLTKNNLVYGLVHYYDNYNLDKAIDFINDKTFSPAFCKDSSFSNQSEFRVITTLPQGKSSVNLSIGHLNRGVILDRNKLDDYVIGMKKIVENYD